MSISDPFIQRPIGTILLSIGLFLVGAVGYSLLPVASLPNVDLPTINVSTSRPGADPAIMAATVAAPLERRLGEIAGVTELTSTSTLGTSSITVQFDLSRSVDGAARDVQAALNAAAADLPTDLPTLADLSQGQSECAAHSDLGADFGLYARGRHLRCRRHGARPAHLADQWRRAGQCQRRRPAGDPHQGQRHAIIGHGSFHGRCADDRDQRQFPDADGSGRR